MRNFKQLDKPKFEDLINVRYRALNGCPNDFSQVGNELSAATRRLDKLEFEESFCILH